MAVASPRRRITICSITQRIRGFTFSGLAISDRSPISIRGFIWDNMLCVSPLHVFGHAKLLTSMGVAVHRVENLKKRANDLRKNVGRLWKSSSKETGLLCDRRVTHPAVFRVRVFLSLRNLRVLCVSALSSS